jgi:hypothetical protein
VKTNNPFLQILLPGLTLVLLAAEGCAAASSIQPEPGIDTLKTAAPSRFPSITETRAQIASLSSPGPQGSAAGSAPKVAKPLALKPGEYSWHPKWSPRGPVVIIISLPEQLAYVYRNGIRIGTTTVSTGRRGYQTPTGVFTIVQKKQRHVSNLYEDAEMPYMQRLTWDGVALHGGRLPGYPASHGCIRLPLKFSKLLYDVTSMGTTVVIADTHSAPQTVLPPGLLLLPPEVDEGQGTAASQLPESAFVWQPESSPSGPVSLLISGAERMIYVYRNGILIGRASLQIKDPHKPLGTSVFTMLERFSGQANPEVSAPFPPRWTVIDLPLKTEQGRRTDIQERLKLPQEFAQLLYGILEPGATLTVTDQPATSQTTSAKDLLVRTGP